MQNTSHRHAVSNARVTSSTADPVVMETLPQHSEQILFAITDNRRVELSSIYGNNLQIPHQTTELAHTSGSHKKVQWDFLLLTPKMYRFHNI